jgi:FtsP/CotA-like multicopper oxidase with cupredoxin domain
MQHVSKNGRLDVTLTVDLVDSLHGIEWSINRKRTAPGYNGAAIGPTLRVRPGDTLQIILQNNLSPSPTLDHELHAYVMDPRSDDANVTAIYNRLSKIGNIVSP